MMSAELLRKRAAARGWVSRCRRKLEELLDSKDLDIVALQAAKADCEKKLNILDEVQSEVELSFPSEAEMIADIESAAGLREEITEVLCKANAALNQKAPSSVGSSGHLKLPKLELPKFDGSVLQWQSFWESFEAAVHCSDIPDVSKFAYLRSFLIGEAKESVAGLPLTGTNYQSACDLLKARFGRPEIVIFSHIQELLSVPDASSSGVQSLRELQDRLLAHIRSLASLDINGDRYGIILVPMILSKLPPDIRLEWAREGSGREADLDWLLSFLSQEISRRERSRAFGKLQVASAREASTSDRSPSKATSGPQHRRKREQRERTPAAAALQTGAGARPVCAFCGQAHQSEVCLKLQPLSVPERRDAIRQAGLCFRCLCAGHVARRCSTVCVECGGQHNVVCCFRLHGGGVQREHVAGATGGSDSMLRSSDCNPLQRPSLACQSGGHERSSTVLPTARVTVLGQDGKRVQATVLFDSGSDRTYIK